MWNLSFFIIKILKHALTVTLTIMYKIFVFFFKLIIIIWYLVLMTNGDGQVFAFFLTTKPAKVNLDSLLVIN